MISVNNLSVQFTGVDLFNGITFNIGDHDRIGLVGKNGAGKSTLLKILCRQQEPETGTITIASGQTVGYLPQEMVPDTVGSVLDETMTAFEQIDQMEAEQQRLTQQITERTDYESKEYEKLLSQLHDITEHIALLGGSNRRELAEKILLGLGFKHSDFERLVAEFSGGWQMRVELAKLLLKHPNFILLDEPTNHLDIESIQWLESYLSTYEGAVVLVSHDRTFLDNITKRTIEITAGRIYDYKVPYSEYVVQMQERRASQMASLTNQQRQVAQIEAFIERFRYKATKSKQVQSRIKMLERMEKINIDEVSTESIHFQFPPAPHSGKIVLEAQHLGKAYGDNQVFDNVDFLVTKGTKLAFVGRNGEGKTTLAKIIVGELTDYSGVFKLGHQVQIGYYAQNQAAMLDGEKTVFQTIDDAAVGDIRPKIRNILGSFLFDNDDIEKKVKVLSGGEKARLALAKLLLTPCNLLVLDEPTNHLDMDSKDILKNALLQYTGTLVVVSHDRDFLQGLTDSLFEFRDGGIHEFKGDIFEFLEYHKMEHLKELESGKRITDNGKQKAQSENKINYQQSKERERELRKLRSNVEKIEQEIAQLEETIANKETFLSSGNANISANTDFYTEYQALKDQLEQRMLDWEEATIALEEFSS
ncbi:MAG: ABC-F family ATP-binding cassette domain-containing protein [Bacteroidales bacterium]|nr:ABC-F family ATP-binding cassette domain-containing protein [Bacteroidales bacterium]